MKETPMITDDWLAAMHRVLCGSPNPIIESKLLDTDERVRRQATVDVCPRYLEPGERLSDDHWRHCGQYPPAPGVA